ncbi:hypothetical protein [Paludibacterium denitrificans]|uniref:Uncharacterized protein n=1 Tax=Paludibacterium denitrificans TaxID=2675226 RepID=A0A844GFH4_9NEIS|nr:hypothetical protein [Paludibacterium denitrificans]MTD34070.1 hypothetical protein [Paludibacterium denitrificans]
MKRFYPQRDYVTIRADIRAKELSGKHKPIYSPQELRQAAARREIENRRIEREGATGHFPL